MSATRGGTVIRQKYETIDREGPATPLEKYRHPLERTITQLEVVRTGRERTISC